MAHKLTLTRKYQVIEYRADDEDILNELTDDATLNVFDALKEMGFRRSNHVYSERIGDLAYDDFIYDDFVFYLSDSQLKALKESVNLDDFELEEVDD